MASEPVDVDPDTIREALEAGTGSVEKLADAVGVVPATLWAWAAGRRQPRPENLRRLADALEARGDALHGMASKLREAADAGP